MLPVDTGDSDNKDWPDTSVFKDMDTKTREELVRLIITNSNTALKEFASKYITTENVDLLYEIVSYLLNYNYRILSDTIKSDKNLTEEFKNILVSAYIATDYYNIYEQSLKNDNVNVSQTIMYELLQNFDTEYQYIKSDGTFDNDKFEKLCELIG